MMLNNQFSQPALPVYKKLKMQQKVKTFQGSSGVTQQVGVSTAATMDLIPAQDCQLCHDLTKMMATVERALYSKYSASQNYYYTKDVNEILSGTRGKALVQFKDFHQQDASEEYLKRVYRLAEYQGKIKMLSEYYKFHKDIPRLYMLPISVTLSKYHNKKRKIDYIRITKMLNIQPEQLDTDSQFFHNELVVHESLERLLDDLDDTEHPPKDNPYLPAPCQAPPKQDLSISNTLQDLNQKLGEIINSTKYRDHLKTDATFLSRDDKLNLPCQITHNPFKKKPKNAKPTDKKHNHCPLYQPKPNSLANNIVPTKPRKSIDSKENYHTKQKSSSKSYTPQSSQQKLKSEKKKVPEQPFTQRQASKSQVSPAKLIQAQAYPSHQRTASSRLTNLKSSRNEENRSDILNLLAKPKQRGSSPMIKPQEPIITQLMKKIQEGNSSILQQLMALSTNDQFKSKQSQHEYAQKIIDNSEALKKKMESQQKGLQSSLNSLLKPVKERTNSLKKNLASSITSTSMSKKDGSKTQRTRIQSQNMESNMFHLNLERINITQNSNQTRIQTARDTFCGENSTRQQAIQENFLNCNQIRQRLENSGRQGSKPKQRIQSDHSSKSPLEASYQNMYNKNQGKISQYTKSTNTNRKYF